MILTIVEPTASLSPSSQSHVLTKDAIAGAILQNLTGGVVATWAIHPALPTGMHFNTGNGTITGTPSVNQTSTTYTIYANNSGGDVTSTLTLTINEPIAVLSPASQSHTFTKDAVAGAILQNLSEGRGHVGDPPRLADRDALQHRERDHHRDPERQSDFDDLHDLRQQLRRRCIEHGLHHDQ